jgi:membrane-associated phospholipid phosphatase
MARRRRACGLAVALAFAVGTLGGGARAHAEAGARAESPRAETVVWLWPRFRTWEYVSTALLWGADLYVRLKRQPPDQPSWVGENAFDDAFRSWLRLDSRAARLDAARVSDFVTDAGWAYPYFVDLPVALFVHRQGAVTWQMLMLDLQANAVAGLINNSLFHLAGRGRPSTPSCAVNPSYDPLCGGYSENASFPSGHVLTIATAAGLVCVHHRYLPLYGSELADAGACVLLSAATAATGALRMMSDRHFMSDVLAGAAIGFGSGYGLPWLLHYRYGKTPEGGSDRRGAVTLLPLAGPDVLGLSVAGVAPL